MRDLIERLDDLAGCDIVLARRDRPTDAGWTGPAIQGGSLDRDDGARAQRARGSLGTWFARAWSGFLLRRTRA